MAEDNLHSGPEELEGMPPEPGVDNGPAQPEPGDVVVDFDKIKMCIRDRHCSPPHRSAPRIRSGAVRWS